LLRIVHTTVDSEQGNIDETNLEQFRLPDCQFPPRNPMTTATAKPKLVHILWIKPSHYDDDGYVIQWRPSSASR